MPLTFPSHAAAILPLHRAAPERLWLVPLVVGSAAPDLAYAIRMNGGFSHSLWGVAAFCVPVGLLVYAWLEALVLPALRSALPDRAAWLRTRGPPASAAQWAWAAAAVAVGALTHVAWDGFTNELSWPARALYGHDVARALQYASSAIGLVIVVAWWWRRRPRLERNGETAAKRCLSPFLFLAAAALGAGVSWLANARDFAGVGWKHTLWLLFFLGLRGIAAGLTLACAALLVAQRRRRFVLPPPPRA